MQLKIDVPFDRLKKYIAELKALALIEDDKTFKITKKGKEYMQEYEKVIDFMQRMNACKGF
jgi:predicted transcriptional regulator